MNGYAHGEQQPQELCPYCGAVCDADFVDVGVGNVQCGPYHCEVCGSSEIGPYDRERVLTEVERATGWYGPGAEPGSSANMIGGKLVGYREALAAYRAEFTGNPLWHDDKYVMDWWEKQRHPNESKETAF